MVSFVYDMNLICDVQNFIMMMSKGETLIIILIIKLSIGQSSGSI